jgi:thioredoxin-related protein
MKHIIFSLLLTSFFLISCSTNNKVYDDNNLNKQNSSIENQIKSLDAQLTHLDAMIYAARLRKDMNETDSTNNQMIENEIMGYEFQKTNVIYQKNTLQMQLYQ